MRTQGRRFNTFWHYQQTAERWGHDIETHDDLRCLIVTLYREGYSERVVSTRTGLSKNSVHHWLKRLGVERRPRGGYHARRGQEIRWRGQSKTCAEWAREPDVQALGLRRTHLSQRRSRGWSPERILTEPLGANGACHSKLYQFRAERAQE